MRLFQNQVYQRDTQCIRIVRIDRYEVDFRSTTGEPQGAGEITTLKKKEFCRLIKGMTLLEPPAPGPKIEKAPFSRRGQPGSRP